MRRLFDAATQFVVVYSSNTNINSSDCPPHVRHRAFTAWVETNMPEWKLLKKVPNIYPYDGDNTRTTFSDFYFYCRARSI